MSHELITTNVLDLTSKQVLFELAIEEQELIGSQGAKLIADLRERAAEAEYTHIYFRDPIRPGIVWFSSLENISLPTRGRLDVCRQITEKVFPDFLDELDGKSDEVIMQKIPPITNGVSGFELATALEYLVFVYPAMVRAWASLIFTYGHILEFHEAAQCVKQACVSSCEHAQIVAYLMGEDLVADPQEMLSVS